MQRPTSNISGNFDEKVKTEIESPYDETECEKKSKHPLKQLLNKIRINRKGTITFIIVSILLLGFYAFNKSMKKSGDIVIILAVNEGGGVERWKTPEEWSVERSSIANKKDYAKRHGYTLTLKDTKIQKRYSHEWREGWQKVDIIKQTMREYPDAEWFWWLDTYTYIMEPELKLEDYILNSIDKTAYRSSKYYNPLDLKIDIPYVDNKNKPINMIITQDCGGFSLGSFFVRRSDWTELLLDTWWDPVLYEQMHMYWEHKEQDCLEFIYGSQPWVRESIGFVPMKAINSFPEGACWDQRGNKAYFYNKNDRDFIVNLAGCNTEGRSCWSEYQNYQKLRAKFHGAWYHFW